VVNVLLFGAVMKRTALALLVAAVLLAGLSANSFSFVEVVKANPYTAPEFTVLSPKNYTIYNASSVTFSFLVESLSVLDYDYYYSLDDRVKTQPISVGLVSERTITQSTPTWTANTYKTYQFSTALDDLSEGQHNLTVHHRFEYYSWFLEENEVIFVSNPTIIFYIDTVAPTITNLSVNVTGTTDRLLNFTVDEEANWVGYSLDNQENVTVNGDAILEDLTAGSHKVTVYAEDAAGNEGTSETLYFTVEEPEPTPSPVPLVLASTGAISAVGVVLLFYFKKRKH
jgi:hypothetical protein